MKRCIQAIAAMLLCVPLWSQSVPLGEIIGLDRTIRDPLYSWSAQFPADWTVHGVVRWGDRETTLYLGTMAVPSAFSSIYYKSHASPQPLPVDAEAFLWEEAEQHTDRRIRGGLTSYTPQAGTFAFKYIGGHPAVRFVAHFSSDDRTFCEYIVRVAGERGVAQAMLRVPLVQFEAVRENFEAMADTLLLPKVSTMAAPGGNGRAVSAATPRGTGLGTELLHQAHVVPLSPVHHRPAAGKSDNVQYTDRPLPARGRQVHELALLGASPRSAPYHLVPFAMRSSD